MDHSIKWDANITEYKISSTDIIIRGGKIEFTYHWAYNRIGRSPVLLTGFSRDATIILRCGHHLQGILATKLDKVRRRINTRRPISILLYIYL